jgi:hypothetical protein
MLNVRNPALRHYLLYRSRLFEADPSPALWAAPFSKGALAYRKPHKRGNVLCEISHKHAGPGRRAAAKPQDGLMGMERWLK